MYQALRDYGDRISQIGLFSFKVRVPGTRGHRPRRAARPCHAVAHDGGRVAVIVEVAVDAPVLAAHRAIDAVHPRQADGDNGG